MHAVDKTSTTLTMEYFNVIASNYYEHYVTYNICIPRANSSIFSVQVLCFSGMDDDGGLIPSTSRTE